MSKRIFQSFPCLIFVGVNMPMFAGQAHPNGPENRPFVERTIRIQDKAQDCVFSLAYPKPDDIVDWAPKGLYNAADPYPTPLTLVYQYRGYFWQGVFGGVTLELKINSRKPDQPKWEGLESLLEGVRIQRIAHNKVTKNNPPESRQEWMEPVLSQLNGVQCVQQYVYKGSNPKGEWHYYFPLGDDHAVELIMWLVDNSNRPGLTKSDWQPRAEAFANRLLSTVRIRMEAKPTQK